MSKQYNPYADSSMMKKDKERKIKNSNYKKKEDRSYLTAKQLSDLEYTHEPGVLSENIVIESISKEEKARLLKEIGRVGINFHDPYGFTDGFRG